jgi:hypothetical protein
MKEVDEDAPKDNSLRTLLIGFTVVMLLAVAVRFYFAYRAHVAPATTVAKDETPDTHLTNDDLVFPRNLHASSLADLQALDGKRVWVQSGGETVYYAATAKGADLKKPLGYLQGAEPLEVVKFVSQQTPADPYVTAWIGMLFHKPSDAKTLLATQVGTTVGKQDNIVADQKFYYDDPHGLYKWPADVWKSVEAHQAIPGMNEFQANLALGPISKLGNGEKGDRTNTYVHGEKLVDVTFAGNKATKITGE